MAQKPSLSTEQQRRSFLKWSALSGTGLVGSLAGCAGQDSEDSQTTEDGTGTTQPSDDSDTDSATDKTVFRFATPAEQVSLDAANANLSYGWEWTYLHYNSLLKLQYDWENDVIETVPDLAESYEWEDDQTVQFTLRDDITFHNGDKMDAELVKKELQYNLDNLTTIGGQVYLQLTTDQISIDNDNTVNVHFSNTIAPSYFKWLWPRVMMANPYLREERGKGNFSTNPKGGGTGPYKFESYTSGSEIVLSKYDDYHEDGVPVFDRAICKILPEGSTRVAQLKTGDLDLDNFVSATDWKSLQSNDSVTTRQGRSTMTIGIIGNYEYDESMEPLRDKRVRRALAQAVNREQFAEAVFEGVATPISIPTLPGSWWHYPEYHDRNFFDLENAKSLLEEAGYGDGFEVQMNVGSDSWHKTMGQIIKSMWGQVGVTLNLNPMESSTLWTRVGTGEFPLAISEHLAPPDPDWFLRAYCVPRNDEDITSANGWEHEEYFDLAKKGRFERDQEKRVEIYRRMNEIWAEEMPMMWFSNGYNIAVHNNNLKDYWLYPGDYSREANRYVDWG